MLGNVISSNARSKRFSEFLGVSWEVDGEEDFGRYARLTAHGYSYISLHLKCCVWDGTLEGLCNQTHPPSYRKMVQIT